MLVNGLLWVVVLISNTEANRLSLVKALVLSVILVCAVGLYELVARFDVGGVLAQLSDLKGRSAWPSRPSAK